MRDRSDVILERERERERERAKLLLDNDEVLSPHQQIFCLFPVKISAFIKRHRSLKFALISEELRRFRSYG